MLDSKFTKNVTNDFWTAWNTENDSQVRIATKKAMRWTTLGYHYDWTNKIYNEDNKSPFPRELDALMSLFAQALNFKNFKSEAAIINFYHIGTTLSAHVDQSEICSAPLFSVSFGQSAIFLIGGKSRDDEALPIMINSGDVVIMSGNSHEMRFFVQN